MGRAYTSPPSVWRWGGGQENEQPSELYADRLHQAPRQAGPWSLPREPPKRGMCRLKWDQVELHVLGRYPKEE